MSDPSSVLNIPRDQYESLMGTLGGVTAVPEQNAALEKQMDMAKLLREGPAYPQGTHIAPGSVYVGPNALQSAASGLSQYAAMQQSANAVNRMTSNAGKLQDSRSRYMDLMARILANNQGGGGAPQPAPAGGDTPGGGP